MTFAGVLLGVAIGIVLLSWVMNLVGRDRLYVGYGVIFVLGTLAAMTVSDRPATARRGDTGERGVASGSVPEHRRAGDFHVHDGVCVHADHGPVEPCDASDEGAGDSERAARGRRRAARG